ncbi:hypothetical protein TRIUR3_33447 [Triticum urartu]|uniref:Uncharacterized protein n=1 Tax=Triticum urartu TaxID=4572 RepID=M7ZK97_TRIUA|nr:hypothetical protein TRIUR3_33447 [Triticum urartu]
MDLPWICSVVPLNEERITKTIGEINRGCRETAGVRKPGFVPSSSRVHCRTGRLVELHPAAAGQDEIACTLRARSPEGGGGLCEKVNQQQIEGLVLVVVVGSMAFCSAPSRKLPVSFSYESGRATPGDWTMATHPVGGARPASRDSTGKWRIAGAATDLRRVAADAHGGSRGGGAGSKQDPNNYFDPEIYREWRFGSRIQMNSKSEPLRQAWDVCYRSLSKEYKN